MEGMGRIVVSGWHVDLDRRLIEGLRSHQVLYQIDNRIREIRYLGRKGC